MLMLRRATEFNISWLIIKQAPDGLDSLLFFSTLLIINLSKVEKTQIT